MSQKVKYSVLVDKEKHSIKRCDSSSSFNDTKKEEDRYDSFYINHSLNLIWITKSVRQLKYFQTYYYLRLYVLRLIVVRSCFYVYFIITYYLHREDLKMTIEHHKPIK